MVASNPGSLKFHTPRSEAPINNFKMTAPPNRLPFQEQGAERKEESHDGRDGASNAHRKDGVKEDGDGSGGNSSTTYSSSSSVVAPLPCPGDSYMADY